MTVISPPIPDYEPPEPIWHRWFAWYPVEIDAYRAADIKNGRTRYRVWLRWVEYCHAPEYDGEDEEVRFYRKEIQFRLPQS